MGSVTERRTIHAHSGLPGTVSSAVGEIIPGYTLQERIGAGGYGEVWRASAPGGLLKAVKIVYGTLTERHAVVEMKSLERIKDVRHPFILTLERIEIVDGRLVVVTELADGSLRDRFEETIGTGGPGIPRDALLRYMQDVADALDYMYDQHTLQHLDIKPENLLLIGGRVKVADFGLTKDLRDASLSAVAGLTPLYAAPEVFEGKPSRHSDQYSLACVYQYLLTGQPPFRGRTSAQLISQHLHSSPDLTLLPRSDHSAILKALAKDSRKRFESCTAFIRALDAAGHAGVAAPAADPREAHGSKKLTGTPASAAEREGFAIHETDVESETDLDARSPRILRPVSIVDVNLNPRPAVVVGLGGVAGRLLKALKVRLAACPEGQSAAPVRLLYIDTDEDGTYEAMYGKDGESLTHADVLTTPLKRSSAYRRKFKRLLEWIARRWLFNIPRSQKTEGIRALGRLAFIDHYREISLAFRKFLERVVQSKAPADPAKSDHFKYKRELPRVIIVADVGGGTGSGMAVDAGYAMRGALAELGLDEAGLTGLFLQSDSTAWSNSTLAVANGMAFLRELAHFSRSGRFPGDDDVGIPETEYLPPFDRSYFVRLANAGTQRAANTEAEAVEYLYRSLRGHSAGVFDFLRGTGGEPSKRGQLNSFVAKVIGGDPGTAKDQRGTQMPVGLWTDLTLDVHKRLLKARGAARLLIATAGADSQRIAAINAQCGEFATVIRDDDPQTFICDEIEAIPYGDIAALLQADSAESADIAAMLTTRIDVDWDA